MYRNFDRMAQYGGRTVKKNEVLMASGLMSRLKKNYDSLFHEDGTVRSFTNRKGCTREHAKQEIRLIRRLLNEVAKEL